jgi:hypothetical protein
MRRGTRGCMRNTWKTERKWARMKHKGERDEEEKREGGGGVFPSSTELNREPISQSFGFGVGPHTNEMFHPLTPQRVSLPCHCYSSIFFLQNSSRPATSTALMSVVDPLRRHNTPVSAVPADNEEYSMIFKIESVCRYTTYTS